ncbi:MAG TPA: carbohydrate kinase [Acidimicrobiales bacterium]|nr:carbohydrate kinase [Acidimicrobiales bacterium]
MGLGGAVLVVGECLADIKPVEVPGAVTRVAGVSQAGKSLVAFPGGGPANIAVGLARLGVPVAFAGRFAREGLGPWLLDHVTGSGVDTSFSVASPSPATIALVTMGEAGGATYAFYGPGTADWQWSLDELPDAQALAGHEPPVVAVHTGSLATALDPGAEVLAGWLGKLRRDCGVTLSYDPNVRPGLMPMDRMVSRVEAFVGLSDLVKVSLDDLEALYPGRDAERIAGRWLEGRPGVVVVTMGADGAMAWSRSGSRGMCPAPKVDVTDTIGAGDSFMSALLAHFLEQGQLSYAALAELPEPELGSALRRAITASAITCTRSGANPPTAAELAGFEQHWQQK